MKVIRNLQITPTEFFNTVFDELIEQIQKTDKCTFSRSDFKKGFKYVHGAEDMYARVDFEIVDYQEESFYKCLRTSVNGTTTISYEVVPNETGITVTFEQEIKNRKEGKKPPKLFALFSEINTLGRMTDKLYSIQNLVLNEKEGFIEKKSNSPFIPDIKKMK